MEIRLKPEAEEQAQHVKRVVDRLLKAAAMIGVAGLLLDKAIVGGIALGGWLGLGLLFLGSLVGVFVVTAAAPMVVFFAVAFDPTKNLENWRPWAKNLFGASFAVGFAFLIAGLFWTQQFESASASLSPS